MRFMVNDKKSPSKAKKEDALTLAPLDFEEALENLLQVKPEKKTAPKKKSNVRKTRKTKNE